MTRPSIEIDITEVERLAGLGHTQEEIADSLGISYSTLNRRRKVMEDMQAAIKRGKARAGIEVSNKLFGLIQKGDLGAIIWFEKTRRGLSDKMTHNITNDIDWSKVPADVLDAYRAGQATIDDVRRSITR